MRTIALFYAFGGYLLGVATIAASWTTDADVVAGNMVIGLVGLACVLGAASYEIAAGK